MKKINFCGIHDVIDCIRDDVYTANNANKNHDYDIAISCINRSIKHAENLLRRFNDMQDLLSK